MFQGIGFDTNLLRAVVDIIVVTYLVYTGLLVIKGTRAAPMLGGLSLVVLVYMIAKFLGLTTAAWILGNFLGSIILIVIVIFQDEIRRGLTRVGLQPLFVGFGKPAYDTGIEEVTLATDRLAKNKIGALIVIQRDVGLEEFVEDGVILDARLDRKLIYSLFLKESPLHDGALVLHGGRIKAAGCVLPLSYNPDLDPNLGTRHRAALGLSERSDALIVVVSEENGSISLVRDGKITRNLDVSMLSEALHRNLASIHQLVDEDELSEELRT